MREFTVNLAYLHLAKSSGHMFAECRPLLRVRAVPMPKYFTEEVIMFFYYAYFYYAYILILFLFLVCIVFFHLKSFQIC